MLKLIYLFENFDLAREALKHWEHDIDTLDRMLSNFRISSNAIYPFCHNGQVCFLRLAPVDEKIEQNILGEIEFIEFLSRHDYPALKPITTLSGEKVIRLDTKWGEYYACAFKKVVGVQIEATDMSKEIMFEYGKTLGKLHALSSDFQPSFKKWTHIEVLKWIEEVLAEYSAPANVILVLIEVKKELADFPISDDNYGLIHYDFELDNVFYDDNTKSCAVIDFDDSMYHWYALDIEQVFDSLNQELGASILQNAKDEFMKGYKTEYYYSDEMENSRPLMRRFINLYRYARLIRCVAGNFSNEPNWLLDLRKKLDNSIRKLEQGMPRFS
jgi:Ser/Thr protein kinase RdoA (MazF antagonist)